MTSSQILASSDHCARSAFYRLRWEPPSLSPHAILRQSVEFGLTSTADDFAKAAYDHAMEVCCHWVIDTPEADLLSLATHIAAMAEMIVFVLRSEGPWERSTDIQLSGALWESSGFTGVNPERLSGLALVDRLDGMREMELRHGWGVRGEVSVHQKPMDVLTVVIGAMRKGRWSNPFTSAYRHPVGKMLRFRKRDGEEFSSQWTKVAREDDEATREDWLDAMTDDGVLIDCIKVVSVEIPVDSEEIVKLATAKLKRIAAQGEAPEPQPSQCFNRLHPCAYRSCCPNGVEPSEATGFQSIERVALPRFTPSSGIVGALETTGAP